MSFPLPLPIGTGFTANPSAPDYIGDLQSKEKVDQRSKGIQQGSNAGAILAKDSLEVPLEAAMPISSEQIGSGRPALMPLFRTIQVKDKEVDNLTDYFAQRLRQSLNPDLKTRLEEDEKQLFDDRDPDLIALDQGIIQFGAELLSRVALAGLPASSDDAQLIAAQRYLNLPEQAKQAGIEYGLTINQYLDQFLADIGHNDPSYQLLKEASDQLKETLGTIKYGF